MRRRPGRWFPLLLLAAVSACSPSQVRYRPQVGGPEAEGRVRARLYLVGDGGEVNPHRDAVLAHLGADLEAVAGGAAPPPVVVAFLGDNIYDEGAAPEPSAEDVAKLAGQVLALPTSANVSGVFLPGNHDWAAGASFSDGKAAVERQRRWVDTMSAGRRVTFLPDDGCPGPTAEPLGDAATLLFIDTEWLLRSPQGECGTSASFYERLAAQLRAHRDRPTILLSHHPLASGGPHGGNVAPLEKGPLLFWLAKRAGASPQDMSSSAYEAMRKGIADAIAASGAPPFVHAAGHDHSLQVIRLGGADQPRYQLVSGALARSSRVRRVDGMRYATEGYGYLRLDFMDSTTHLVVFARGVDGGPVRPVFTCTISLEAPPDECPEAPLAGGSSPTPGPRPPAP